MLAPIDTEIGRLQQVRSILAGASKGGRKSMKTVKSAPKEASVVTGGSGKDCGSAKGTMGEGEDSEIDRVLIGY